MSASLLRWVWVWSEGVRSLLDLILHQLLLTGRREGSGPLFRHVLLLTRITILVLNLQSEVEARHRPE